MGSVVRGSCALNMMPHQQIFEERRGECHTMGEQDHHYDLHTVLFKYMLYWYKFGATFYLQGGKRRKGGRVRLS
jgi:hypothetical protein